MADDGDWFAPKRFGFGAGLPIAWQGWALLGVYAAGLALAGVTLSERHPALFAAIAVLLTIPMLILCAQHTRGGWRWRWGGDD